VTIDWTTLALQTVNVLVVLWLLPRRLYRPVLAVMEQRQQQAAAVLADAQREAQAAREARAQLDSERLAAQAQHHQWLADAKAEVDGLRNRRLQALDAELAQRRASADAQLDAERQAAQQALNATALSLGSGLARRVLQQLPADALRLAYVDSLGPAPSLAHADPARVTTAQPLDAAARADLKTRLDAWLGRPLDWQFAVDADLQAGLVLDLGDRHIDHSLAGELARLAAVNRDDDAR